MTTTLAPETLDASGLHFSEFNARIRAALKAGAEELTLTNVNGQRYIGAGLQTQTHFEIYGTPGNDLGVFMDGPSIRVHANAQDGVANTMSSGEIFIHGRAGDVLAYAMRGGRVFVRGDAGYRVGIHMKAYEERVPVAIIGGCAQDYFGEYMAGGILVLLGLDRPEGEPVVGDFLASGMHGGEIYIRGPVHEWQIGKGVGQVEINDEAWRRLSQHLEDYAREFNLDNRIFKREDFTRLKPTSHRPYSGLYVY
jgi:glutamate synthase domain-containing protein 3